MDCLHQQSWGIFLFSGCALHHRSPFLLPFISLFVCGTCGSSKPSVGRAISFPACTPWPSNHIHWRMLPRPTAFLQPIQWLCLTQAEPRLAVVISWDEGFDRWKTCGTLKQVQTGGCATCYIPGKDRCSTYCFCRYSSSYLLKICRDLTGFILKQWSSWAAS